MFLLRQKVCRPPPSTTICIGSANMPAPRFPSVLWIRPDSRKDACTGPLQSDGILKSVAQRDGDGDKAVGGIADVIQVRSQQFGE